MFRFLLGLLTLLLALGGAHHGVRSARRALMPRWTGAPGALVDAVGMISVIIVVTQFLGLLAIYHPATVLAALLATGYGLRYVGIRLEPRVDVPIVPGVEDRLGRPGRIIATIAVAAALGPWIVRAAVGFTAGMPGADTRWYHLPAAAKLVQSGSLQQIEFFDGGNLTSYYPLASTWLHAIGMLFLESDLLSPVINLAWTCLALLACWAFGRPTGSSSAALIAGAVALSFPGLVGHNGGSAMNDIVVVALILVALALLVNADVGAAAPPLTVIALAGLATGAALGTKWTIIPAAVGLTVGILVAARRGPWLRAAVVWSVAAVLTGSFTYLRNLVVVGNPLPPQDLKLGPLEFESVRETEGVASVASWLTDDQAWSVVFSPGLETWFGPLWSVALILTAAGLFVGLIAGPGAAGRLAAFTGLVSALGYLLMPQNLEVLGLPNYFLSNLRYGAPAIVIGFVLLAVAPPLRRGRRVWVLPAAMMVLLATSLTAPGAWTGVDDWHFQDVVGTDDTVAGIVGALAVGLIGLWLVHRPATTRAVAATVLAVALVAAVALRDTYTDARYADPFHEAYELEDASVAISGTLVQYMFYGPDLGNHVQFVAEVEDGVITPPSTCSEWLTGVEAGGYTHVVIGVLDPVVKDSDGPYRWTADDPATSLIRDADGTANLFTGEASGNLFALFSIDGDLDPTRCAR